MIRLVTSLTNKELQADYVKKNTLFNFVNNNIIAFNHVREVIEKKQADISLEIMKLRNKKTRSSVDIDKLFILWKEAQVLKMKSLIIFERTLWLESKNKLLRIDLWSLYDEITTRAKLVSEK